MHTWIRLTAVDYDVLLRVAGRENSRTEILKARPALLSAHCVEFLLVQKMKYRLTTIRCSLMSTFPSKKRGRVWIEAWTGRTNTSPAWRPRKSEHSTIVSSAATHSVLRPKTSYGYWTKGSCCADALRCVARPTTARNETWARIGEDEWKPRTKVSRGTCFPLPFPREGLVVLTARQETEKS